MYGRRVSCCAELMVSSGLESIFDILFFYLFVVFIRIPYTVGSLLAEIAISSLWLPRQTKKNKKKGTLKKLNEEKKGGEQKV
jgi:hypothetical protein